MNESSDFSTPMMVQYMQLKKQYPDCLLWFRLGDFYEMFLEHAKIGSDVLGITLTSRSRGKDGRIPMAGIPYHAADAYLYKLIRAGYKVAICEQMTEPAAGTLVERDVIRVVTPGTVLDEKILKQKENNYIVSLSLNKKMLDVAIADVSTGEFRLGQIEKTETALSEVLVQFTPSECLIAPQLEKDTLITFFFQRYHLPLTQHQQWHRWVQHHSIQTDHPAAAALLGYLEYTQKTQLVHLHTFQPLITAEYLHMDPSTITHLEIFRRSHDGNKEGSLLNVIDHTVTAMGGRLLVQWLHKPLMDQKKIHSRLDNVSAYIRATTERQHLQTELKTLIDIERVLSRLSVKMGTPRDIKNLAESLVKSLEILKDAGKKVTNTSSITSLTSLISKTIIDEAPIDAHSGNFIRSGVRKELDELRKTVTHSRDWIIDVEQDERKKTGITSLKIKFNQVFGFYIEVSNANLHLVPDRFTRKQTLVNGERFTTPDLKHHEEIILSAEEEMTRIEYTLFLELVQKILTEASNIQQLAQQIAEFDCILSLAQLATENSYVRPTITQNGELTIHGGRHPMVEQVLPHQQFVPNDLTLNTTSQQIMIITGPNMAGKSVLMRQTALIILLAHIGSFVPAENATIPITDQIFVRSGAADMITAGLSTFMVEMVETAAILKNATEKSFIIMDEIGRGTSTYDGISIAWAVAEYLGTHLQPGPKTLFATHYHELQALADEHPQLHNYHMSVTEHHSKPVFLYTLKKGGAPHSYGVAVAQLAGLPQPVIKRAQQLLHQLEHGEHHLSHIPQTSDPDAPLRTKLATIDTDHITPLAALNVLAELKELSEAHAGDSSITT